MKAATEYLSKKDWDGDIYFRLGTSAAKGTFILFNKELDNKIHCELVTNWCEQTDLVHIWRLQYPDSKILTWHRKNLLLFSLFTL